MMMIIYDGYEGGGRGASSSSSLKHRYLNILNRPIPYFKQISYIPDWAFGRILFV